MEDFNNAVAANEIGLVRQYLSENPTYDLEQKDKNVSLTDGTQMCRGQWPCEIHIKLERSQSNSYWNKRWSD